MIKTKFLFSFGSIISEINDLVMTPLIFIHLYLPFGSDMLSSCIPFMLEKENKISQENPSNIHWYLQRNNWVVKNIFIVSLLLLGELPRHEYLYNSLL